MDYEWILYDILDITRYQIIPRAVNIIFAGITLSIILIGKLDGGQLRSQELIFSHVSIVFLYKVIQNGPIFI